MKIDLIGYPYNYDWMEVKRWALVTIGKSPVKPPSSERKLGWWCGKCAALRRKPRRRLKGCLCLCVSIAVEYAMKCMGVVKNNDR